MATRKRPVDINAEVDALLAAAGKAPAKTKRVNKKPDPEVYETFGRAGTTLPEDWKRMAEAAGGVKNLADRLGVSQSTLWRWANGAVVTDNLQTIVALAARFLGVPVPEMKSR